LRSHQNVSGFDVAVNTAQVMQVLNCVADWSSDLWEHFGQNLIDVLSKRSGLFVGIIFLGLEQNKIWEL
jgi:hypothetical protein